ncbi:flavocytochrome c [Proteinivorax hydrogeniformans]|uniref:Flavocytochrome c n=1 Tax=Proteinivorax hydrogeniformans TaxID=1826727 RepID=A0AAU8HUN4_9FIRM
MEKIKIVIIILAMVLIPISLAYWFLFEPAIKVDVVVIGAGAGGMSASLEAENQGSSVVLLEKMPYVGGNTVRATAGMNAVLTPQQKEREIKDSKNIFLNDILESGHGLNSVELIEVLIDNSADAVSWLTDLGADLDDVGILAGHSKARTHRPSGGQPIGSEVVKTLSSAIQKSSVDLRLEHKAVEIELDRDDKVKKVQVIDNTGKIYDIKCNSVVVATGGFGGSSEQFVYYNPNLKGYHTTNSPSATGDFIELADKIGAKFTDMEYIQTHPTVSPHYGMLITEAIRGNGGILVNNQGVRFADEMKNRDHLSEDLLAQPDREVYLIFNEDIRQPLAASDDYIDMNIVLSSDTIEELARLG